MYREPVDDTLWLPASGQWVSATSFRAQGLVLGHGGFHGVREWRTYPLMREPVDICLARLFQALNDWVILEVRSLVDAEIVYIHGWDIRPSAGNS